MRRLLVAVGLIASMSDALAGGFETPVLRGSDGYVPAAPAPQLIKWSGFYAGGHAGYGFASMNFAGATREPIAHMLRELALENQQHPSQWQVLGKTDTGGASAGFFFGYNNRWEDVILGFEFNYSRVNHRADTPVSPITRVTATSNGLVYLVNLTGAASMQITDLATVRARAGVQVENFLPYVMIGVAAGRANLSRSATVIGTETVTSDPPIVTPFLFTDEKRRLPVRLVARRRPRHDDHAERVLARGSRIRGVLAGVGNQGEHHHRPPWRRHQVLRLANSVASSE
jgi:opacity protein-like surface antigen